MIDTHKSVKNLSGAGFTDAQAEAFVTVLVDALERNSESIKNEIRQDIKELMYQMDDKFKDIEHKMESDKRDLDVRFKDLDIRFNALDSKITTNAKDLENKINMVLVKVTGTVFSLMLGFKILDRFI